jgi:transcription antitermination factor NusG
MVTWVERDRVRILSGPFEGFTGTIEGVANENDEILVLVDMFGGVTPMWHRTDELITDDGRPQLPGPSFF